jgi:hypothetical protein
MRYTPKYDVGEVGRRVAVVKKGSSGYSRAMQLEALFRSVTSDPVTLAELRRLFR